ncbi:phosphodiester glycosidase family protein [Brevibacillus dissolubilis]|uniref:phosphodiester glycosidase family protein n=1 Tax=Brevibacillus dissolubilis TaxID=1844116 RepID=UPI00210036C1|nr:phosphodiester glycosidase family protein [Brevibacillus dissolubilis]
MPGKFHAFMGFLLAPVCGMMLAFHQGNPFVADYDRAEIATAKAQEDMIGLQETAKDTSAILKDMQTALAKEKKADEAQKNQLDQLLAKSQSSQQVSTELLDNLLQTLLGKPIDQHFGTNSRIKVYSLQEAGYSGYMAKVRVYNPNALKMVMANDTVYSRGETTSHATKRKGAILGINAGGFDKRKGGTLAPLGMTVVDGQIKTYSTNPNLRFVGFNNSGRLVGGKIPTQAEVKQMGVLQGASFLPALLEDGVAKPIPSAWANRREPRTLIGNFENGDLLIIVIDGRNKGGSKGVTLEEAQRKLKEFKVRDAFNLDGGSSSVFYYNGKVLNHPSNGRELPLTTHLVVMP